MRTALKAYNSFQVEAFSEDFHLIKSVEELKSLWATGNISDYLIIGGGSNILFAADPSISLLKNEIRGIKHLSSNENEVLISTGSGENWHEFVSWCVNSNFGGLENLALIPGSLGAAPVQNIGAYGVEVGDLVYQVYYFDMMDGIEKSIMGKDCKFSYRDSIFKHELKGRAFITEVVLKLTRKDHLIQLEYGAIKDRLVENGVTSLPEIKDIFNAVVQIRQMKLPDPAIIGNAGSFFKNPVVSVNILDQLKKKFPSIVSFRLNDKESKLAAGWLIEQSGWKGKSIGDAGCYEKQALVLVNKGSATGKDILNLATRIKVSVFAKFGITLEEEVNIIM